MEILTVMTKEGFEAMEHSVAEECAGKPEKTGIVVALWRLRALLDGYRWALDHGYGVAYEERETQP